MSHSTPGYEAPWLYHGLQAKHTWLPVTPAHLCAHLPTCENLQNRELFVGISCVLLVILDTVLTTVANPWQVIIVQMCND